MVPKENIFPCWLFSRIPQESLLLTALIDQMQQVFRDKEDFAKGKSFPILSGGGRKGEGALGRQKA